MASLFSKFFNPEKGSSARLEGDQESKIQIATCAVLIEIARADDEFTQDEKNLIIDTLKQEFHLSADDAGEIITLATTRMNESIDIWHFTNILNESLSPEDKIKIIEIIWKIIYSDGFLGGHEDALVHKLSFLLELTHDQLIAAKLRILDQMRTS